VILRAVLRQARPPSKLAGRLSIQSLLFALGEGTFMTGSAVFFTQIVGLSAAQVGLGLTLAGIAAFLAALPMGKLVDRFGPKRMWAVSAVGQAAMFSVWPFITDFRGYVVMAVGMEVIGALGQAAHGAYTIDALPPDERVKSRAYMYSALNVGFTLGSLLGGIALAFRSNDVLHALPWFTAAVFLVNATTCVPRRNARCGSPGRDRCATSAGS
jgi:predicted MFS family arabinose efflux permease